MYEEEIGEQLHAIREEQHSLRELIEKGFKDMTTASNEFDADVSALTDAVTAVAAEVATLEANTTDPTALAALKAATANLQALIPAAPTPDAPPASS